MTRGNPFHSPRWWRVLSGSGCGCPPLPQHSDWSPHRAPAASFPFHPSCLCSHPAMQVAYNFVLGVIELSRNYLLSPFAVWRHCEVLGVPRPTGQTRRPGTVTPVSTRGLRSGHNRRGLLHAGQSQKACRGAKSDLSQEA